MARGSTITPIGSTQKLEYHVYDPSVESILGSRVEDKDGSRVVRLTEDQARYWASQGLVGLQARKDLAPNVANAIDQMIGTDVDSQMAVPDPEPRTRRTRDTVATDTGNVA